MMKEKAKQFFEEVKEKAEYKKVSSVIESYTYNEDGWMFTFFVCSGTLKKVEACNHKDLVEIWM